MQARRLPHSRTALLDALNDDRSNPVFEVIDRDRVADAIGRLEELSLREREQVFGAATASMWLARR